MISEVDWCWSRRGCGVFARKCIIGQKLISDLSENIAGITLKTLRIDMCHNDFRFRQMSRPIEFIESNGAAVQLMYPIEIAIHLIMYAIQIKLSITDTITNTSN